MCFFSARNKNAYTFELIHFRRHSYWHFWSNALRRTLQVTCAVQCRVLKVIFMLWLSGVWLRIILYVGNQVPEEHVVSIFRIDPEVGNCTASRHRASLTHSTLTPSKLELLPVWVWIWWVLLRCGCFGNGKQHFLTTLTEVFPCFSSVVRQKPGLNSQIRGTDRISSELLSFVLCLSLCYAIVFMLFCCYYVVLLLCCSVIVCVVLCIDCVYCTTATGC